MIEAVEAIRLEIEGPLATLVLDRPRVLNAGNRQWVADLNEAVAAIAAAPHVRVVVSPAPAARSAPVWISRSWRPVTSGSRTSSRGRTR